MLSLEATEYVAKMIEMIKSLVVKDIAYKLEMVGILILKNFRIMENYRDRIWMI
jgi:cysteinyl-tRNA synthetase